jgi:hypothetical protein
MTTSPPGTHRPATREPMFWLVWGLPAVVVVASIATLVIALRVGGADAVPLEVRRTAQIQVDDTAADQATLARALRGTLSLQPGTHAIEVTLASVPPAATTTLRLWLRHPGRADLDRELTLVAAGDGWHGRLPTRTHAWNLDLSPPDRAWRLTGRLEPDAMHASLSPRLAE